MIIILLSIILQNISICPLNHKNLKFTKFKHYADMVDEINETRCLDCNFYYSPYTKVWMLNSKDFKAQNIIESNLLLDFLNTTRSTFKIHIITIGNDSIIREMINTHIDVEYEHSKDYMKQFFRQKYQLLLETVNDFTLLSNKRGIKIHLEKFGKKTKVQIYLI